MPDKGFEPIVPPFLLGDVDSLQLIDSGFNSKLIVPRTQACQVRVKWHTDGLLAGALGGKWVVRACLESMGPGLEYAFSKDVALLTGVPDGTKFRYDTTVDIAANAVNQNAYRLVVAITYVEPGGQPGPIAAYHEGAIVQFFEP